MRHMIGTLALATCALMLGAHDAGAQQQGDVDGVRAINLAFYEAASARDLAQMEAVWAHEPHVRAIHPGRPIEKGWEAVRGGWKGLFEIFSEISVAMPEPDLQVGVVMAWVTGEEEFRGRLSSGEQAAESLLATSIFEKTINGWRMVHHHVSGKPLPPPQ
jgi:ketosteroid isomerase-like protein